MSNRTQSPDPEKAHILDMGGMVLRPGARLGAYVYEKRIGTGGMAEVLLVRDPNGKHMALKVLKASRFKTGLGRFRREFRSLARLEHKNVIQVDAYGDIFGHPYIAMEYVEGLDLHKVIRGFRQKPNAERWKRSEEVLVDLASALAYIHQRGLVHRDLKPSNILIAPDGGCKLTDFGIVKELDPANDPLVSTTLVGTWAYASPEQIKGESLDHRSDLYSLGVILYAMLTGRRPFVADDLSGYLELHRDQAALPPSKIKPDVPPHLEAICLRLLQKAPRDRFQSGQEILFQLQQVDLESHDGAAVEQSWEPMLVGRGKHLDSLRDAVSCLTRSEGGVVLLEGAQGTGKSRLFRTALEHARLIGIPVHQTAISSGEGAFGNLLALASDLARELGGRVPPELEMAIQAFEKGRGRKTGDLRYQLYDGVRDAMETLLLEGPQIIAVDDLHLAQPPYLGLLGYLSRTAIVRDKLPLLLLVTSRQDTDNGANALFRDGSELGLTPTVVDVGALSQEDVRSVVESAIGEGDKAVALSERLFQETQGNPFFLAEFIRTLIQRGTISPDAPGGIDGDGEITEIAAAHLDIPPGIRQVVLARLAHLSPDEKEIVEIASTLGRELDLDMLLELLDDEEEKVLHRLDRLVDQGLLRERQAGLQTLISFVHSKVGEVVYRALSDDRRIEWHRALGATIEARHGGNPVVFESIGEHYRLAGDFGKAYRYLGQASHSMWERSLLAEAWALSGRAHSIEDKAQSQLPVPDFNRIRMVLLRIQAETLMNRWDMQAAEQVLHDLRLVSRQLGEAEVEARSELDLGRVLIAMGKRQMGEALIQNVLVSAKKVHDRPMVIHALHRLSAAAWFNGDLEQAERLASEGLMSAVGPELAQCKAEMLMTISVVQASRGQLAAATSGLTEAVSIFQGLRYKRERALCLCNLAELLTWQSDLGEAIRRCTEGAALARDVLFGQCEAFAHRVRATALMEAGDEAGAAQDLGIALATCMRHGLDDEMLATRFQAGRLALHRGMVDDAVRELQLALDAAIKRDTESYAPVVRATLARAFALQGRPEVAQPLLDAVEPVIETLALPRQTELMLAVAEACHTLNQQDTARHLARQAAQQAAIRGFRAWALQGRVLLVQLTTGEEREKAKMEARALADMVGETLSDELGVSFEAKIRACFDT